MDQPSIVTQPHLGRVKDNYKPHNSIGGYLALAIIIKVNHKYRTADVSIVNTRDVISSETNTEGKFGVKISTSHASFDEALLCSSGVIEPMQEGDLVLLAFMDNSKSKPIILCSFPNTDSVNSNILPPIYPINPDNSLSERKEALKYLKVYPSQLYQRVDGEGGMETSYPSRTFLKVDSDRGNVITDNTFDHGDLQEKDPRTNTTRSGVTEESVFPVKVLFVHRSNYNDSTTTWSKFFIDRTGLIRVSRNNRDGKLTYNEIKEDGRYTIRRQLDSNIANTGTNNTEFIMGVDGSTRLTRNIGSSKTEVYIDASGKLHISSNQDISIEGNLVINSNLTVTGTINASAMNINGVRVATINDIP